MDKDLADLIQVSNEIGRDPDLVQGGGGNTSVKACAESMYVKASGTALADMAEGLGYRLVALAPILSTLDDPELAAMEPTARDAEVLRRLMDSCLDEGRGRPSVETALHAMLGRCVVHAHPSVMGGLLCAKDGRAAIEDVFADADPPLLFVGYTDPGYPLAVHVRQALGDYGRQHGRLPQLVFLENHGLFVSAEGAQEAMALTRDACKRVERAWRDRVKAVHERSRPVFSLEQEAALIACVAAAARDAYAEVWGRRVLVRFSMGDPVKMLLAHPDAARLAATAALVPDQMVYCRGGALWVPAAGGRDELRRRATEIVKANADGEHTPSCLLVDGLGLFAVGDSPRLLESTLSTMEAAFQMLVVAAAFGGPRGLSPKAIETIRGWEVERYRRSLMSGEAADDALAGQVAVVSGAGSGIGRGIAIGLAKKGVHVLLADIDLAGARETAARITATKAPGSGTPARVDVTGEQAVKDLFSFAVSHLGGVDMLVNAAGIGPTFPLVDFPVDAWRKALEINLTGYFLMGREAARMMVHQGTGGGIVNISSKTGLQASKNHSAYNATKAAQIHLARGWALDLAEHGIRVNTICPGNVFHESKIWNEDYIKALGEKRGLKPEEVIPYYINLTALKQEITWDDLAEAAAFLLSPASAKITGQTLVVDAGQVFVR